MSNIQIEQNVPVPPRTNMKASKYPWGLMDEGDSFSVDGKSVSSMRTTASAAGKRLGMKFIVRAEGEDSVRVWRVA